MPLILNIRLVLNIPSSEYASGSEYTKILNMSLVLDIPEFAYASSSEDTRVQNMLLVLNTLGFLICLWF